MGLDFQDYSLTVNDAVNSWGRRSLHKLGDEENEAALKISPIQLVCYSKLMQAEGPEIVEKHNTIRLFE